MRWALPAGRAVPAADAARKAVENALKAVIACYANVPRVRDAAGALQALLDAGASVEPALRPAVARLIEIGAQHGLAQHLRLCYGDEPARKTPAEVTTQEHARTSVADAEQALELAARVVAVPAGAGPGAAAASAATGGGEGGEGLP